MTSAAVPRARGGPMPSALPSDSLSSGAILTGALGGTPAKPTARYGACSDSARPVGFAMHWID